ncbi:5-oxoprolinase subunit PxpB [Pedobacter sp. AW1-32]|uniref:5-oxoprolinase subunit PxpB n=1 Tax=Pedobacter sp. AW1-32 TaxID=3383026 RepID=UPI003FEED6EA
MISYPQTEYTFLPLGDSALLIQLEETIDPKILSKLNAIGHYLEDHPFKGLIEYVPAFSSITIFFNPLLIGFNQLTEYLNSELKYIESKVSEVPAVIDIPVVYGGEYGPDLDFISAQTGLLPEEIISIHTKPEYVVYMIGFAPGFPYLGGMDERIAAPRKEKPRGQIAAGSVGIAGKQTGIYPIETPGGWQIIGRTPLSLFDIEAKNPTLLKAGNRIRFKAISALDFEKQNGEHGY